MARVTVEDCIEKVPNRFELVMLALQRSRDIANGANPNLPRDGDKNPVIALREIAESKVDRERLLEDLTEHFRLPLAAAEADEEAASAKRLETTPEVKFDEKESGDAEQTDDQEETLVKEWSEDEMIRGMQDMPGEPSP